MSEERKRTYHKRHRDWEVFDEIRIKLVERYKSSGLSGDEWRFSVVWEFLHKGRVVHEGGGYHDVETALKFLPVDVVKACEPIPEGVIEIDKKACDQPGCGLPATRWFWLKQEFSSAGDLLDQVEQLYHRAYRQFCERHSRRGDCSREDSDANYEEFKPNAKTKVES